MKIQTTRGRLLASSMICGVTFAALASAAPAFAQNEVEAVVVTGSRIPQPNLTTASPVTQVTSADITTAGVSRVEDLVNQLPQAFAAQNSSVSNGSTGTATVDLRGLGADRTLVLIDGRRMPYGSPLDAAADLNQIPTSLVDRVEVLTGGASAVYGSDAIAGVVNFIMKKDFEGVQLDAQYSFYQHHNDFSGKGDIVKALKASAALNPSEFKVPDSNVIDGYGKIFSATFGVSSPDNKGNITAYLTYQKNDAISQGNRDFSACTIAGPVGSNDDYACGGSSTAAGGRFTSRANGANLTLADGGGFRNYNGATDSYNFGPSNYYQRPDERYSLGALGHYEVNEHADVYFQAMFTDYSTVAQIAPSGAFYGSGPTASGGYNISCSNPLLTGLQATQLGCVGGAGSVDVAIGKRNVEGGGRQDDLRYQSYRTVLGVRGALGEGWSYDIAGQYSRVQLSRKYLNEMSKTRLARSLDVIAGPGGVPMCRSAVDPDGEVGPLAPVDASCVPYNIFTKGGVTKEALAYLQVPGVQTGATIQQVVTGSVAGDLSSIGLKSPWAENGVQVAFGAEYRRDTLESTTDTSFSTNDLAGQGGATIGFNGFTENYDLFAEARVPILDDKPFAKTLALELAYRFSDYNSGVNTDTYKIGLDWAPVEDLRFRASYQRAVRAPNVIDLFQAQGLNLFDLDADPCGPSPTATAAQCYATGVPDGTKPGLPNNYGGGDLENSSGQYNYMQSGNTKLTPEVADTYTYGFVFTPRFLSGFNLSVDYFNIDLANRIDKIDPLVTLSQCYSSNDAVACARIHRSSLGTLWTGGGYIEAFNTNIGGLKTAGVDINANYRFDLADIGADFGALSFNFVGTYLDKLETNPGSGAVKYDCVGFYGNACETPKPKWRHSFRTTWSSPWKADLSFTWRYYGGVDLFDITDGVPGSVPGRSDSKFKAESYFDLAGNWTITDGVKVRAGVNNILDNDPQLSASVGTIGNGNTYPQTYDSFGRYVFMGVTLDF